MANQQLQLNVEGMSCNHCKMAVESAVKTLPGVTSAHVSLEAKQVTVDFEDGQTTREQLQAAIEEAGFEVV